MRNLLEEISTKIGEHIFISKIYKEGIYLNLQVHSRQKPESSFISKEFAMLARNFHFQIPIGFYA